MLSFGTFSCTEWLAVHDGIHRKADSLSTHAEIRRPLDDWRLGAQIGQYEIIRLLGAARRS
jgi:hypothetical protein